MTVAASSRQSSSPTLHAGVPHRDLNAFGAAENFFAQHFETQLMFSEIQGGTPPVFQTVSSCSKKWHLFQLT